MRVIVFFDLPMITDEERREYTRFRRFLLQNGFVMMQESVYTKIVLNSTACEAVKVRIRKNCTRSGLVQILSVTEKQFGNIELLVGDVQNEIIDSDEKLVII